MRWQEEKEKEEEIFIRVLSMISDSTVKKLRRGDVVTHIDSGKEFVVIENNEFGVTAVCSVRVSSGLEWVHSFTPGPVIEPPLPSLTQMVFVLEGHGWTYDETLGNGRWVSPDKSVYRSLGEAWRSRHLHTTKTKVVFESGPKYSVFSCGRP